MKMTEKMTRHLYTAYEEIAATPHQEDVLTGMAYADQTLGQSLTQEEAAGVKDFLRRHEQELAGVYREGYETFAAKVAALEAEDAAKEEPQEVE